MLTDPDRLRFTLLAGQTGSGWTCLRCTGTVCRAPQCLFPATHLWVDRKGNQYPRCADHPPREGEYPSP